MARGSGLVRRICRACRDGSGGFFGLAVTGFSGGVGASLSSSGAVAASASPSGPALAALGSPVVGAACPESASEVGREGLAASPDGSAVGGESIAAAEGESASALAVNPWSVATDGESGFSGNGGALGVAAWIAPVAPSPAGRGGTGAGNGCAWELSAAGTGAAMVRAGGAAASTVACASKDPVVTKNRRARQKLAAQLPSNRREECFDTAQARVAVGSSHRAVTMVKAR